MFSVKFKFSGINIYSKKSEVVFGFYKKLGFRVLEECSPDDNGLTADENCLFVCEYEDNGSDAEIIVYKKRRLYIW